MGVLFKCEYCENTSGFKGDFISHMGKYAGGLFKSEEYDYKLQRFWKS